MTRAVSSVLDVTVCLLLVSASAVTLTHAPTPADRANRDRGDRADAVLGVVTTSTAWIEYPADGSGPNRTAHGTLANLVASGTATNATADGDPLPSMDGYRRTVTSRVRRATARLDVRVQLVARWRPHGSRVRGRFVVGPSPPRTANVHAASTTLPWMPTGAARAAPAGEVRLTARTWSR